MQKRRPYCDLGLVVAVGVFICVAIKCLLFGFTVINAIWLLMACGYFFITWKLKSEDPRMKHSTTAFLVLSVVAMVASSVLDQNTRPTMHAFEGVGDTIADYTVKEEVVEEVPVVKVDSAKNDSLASDSLVEAANEANGAAEQGSATAENDSTAKAE